MRAKHEDTEVRISRQTLWIGAEAFPLQTITRVRPIEINQNRPRVLVAYARRAIAWAGIGAAGLVFLLCLLRTGLAIKLSLVLGVLVLGALVVQTVQLIRRLTSRLYMLSIATEGSAGTALVSENRQVIYDLALKVVDAIDDPAMEYAIHIKRIDYGGDTVGGDKHGSGDAIFEDRFGFESAGGIIVAPTTAPNDPPVRPSTAGNSPGQVDLGPYDPDAFPQLPQPAAWWDEANDAPETKGYERRLADSRQSMPESDDDVAEAEEAPPIDASDRPDIDVRAQHMDLLRSLVDREGPTEVQQALMNVFETLQKVATATAIAAQERS